MTEASQPPPQVIRLWNEFRALVPDASPTSPRLRAWPYALTFPPPVSDKIMSLCLATADRMAADLTQDAWPALRDFEAELARMAAVDPAYERPLAAARISFRCASNLTPESPASHWVAMLRYTAALHRRD